MPSCTVIVGIVSMPENVRREALFAAALFAILATGVALWRSRFSVLAILALVVATAIVLYVWKSRWPAPDGAGEGMETLTVRRAADVAASFHNVGRWRVKAAELV